MPERMIVKVDLKELSARARSKELIKGLLEEILYSVKRGDVKGVTPESLKDKTLEATSLEVVIEKDS